MNGIAAKMVDAANMFWQALDSEEKRLLILYGIYLSGCVVLSYQRGSRERFRAQLLEEVHGARREDH